MLSLQRTRAEKQFSVEVSVATACQSHASRGKTWSKNHIIFLEDWVSVRGIWNYRWGRTVEFFLELVVCVGFALGTKQGIFPRLWFSAVYFIFPLMCKAGISSQPLDCGSRLPLLAYRFLSGYQKSEALNFANQNPTVTFPLHVTWSASFTDTWKISFTHLTQGNTGNLGLWNVPAALSCLGFSAVGLVHGPGLHSSELKWTARAELGVCLGPGVLQRGGKRGVGRLPAHFSLWGRGHRCLERLGSLTSWRKPALIPTLQSP